MIVSYAIQKPDENCTERPVSSQFQKQNDNSLEVTKSNYVIEIVPSENDSNFEKEVLI